MNRHRIRKAFRQRDWPTHLPWIWHTVTTRIARIGWTLLAGSTLRLYGCRIGPGLRVDGPLIVRSRRRAAIVLGRNVTINSRHATNLVGLQHPTILHSIDDGRIEIGDGCGISSVVLSARTSIRLGRYVKLGGNVRIFDHDYHSLDFDARRSAATDRVGCRTKPIRVEDDVFIGTCAIVLKGVSIGARAIVGAGSVVTCDIPPDEIWAGNPARRVRGPKHGSPGPRVSPPPTEG